MALTVFPDGILATPSVGSSGNLPFGSRYFYVNSAGSGGGDGGFDTPYSTLAGALTAASANAGHVIVLMANHAETITGVGGLAFSKAGVTVVGMGDGNQRPRFLMDGGATVSATVTAADVTIRNVEFAAGHASVATCFDVTAANLTLDGIEFTDNTTSEFFLVCVRCAGAANTADGLTVKNCRRFTAEAATDFISHAAAIKNLRVLHNVYIADAATGAGLILSTATMVISGLECIGNTLICGNTAGSLLIDNTATTNSGYAAWNFTGHHDVAAAVNIACVGIRLFSNYMSDSDTESGALSPAADTMV